MKVVYTSIIGGYDVLYPAVAVDDISYVCFTDTPNIKSQGWQIRHVPTSSTPRRASRLLKARSDVLFPDAEASLWLDAACAPRDIARCFSDAGGADLVAFKHTLRQTFTEEARHTIRRGQSPNGLVEQQLADYTSEGFDPSALSAGCGILRRQTPLVTQFNVAWEDHLLRYGLNDQLSFDYCAWKCGLPVTFFPFTHKDNPYMVYRERTHLQRRRAGWAP